MRISRLRVTDFLSLKDTGAVSLDPSITLLLGKNENGKTNLLLALESFDRESRYDTEDLCRYSETRERVRRGEIQASEVPIVTLWFMLDSKDKRGLAEIDRALANASELEVTKYLDNHYSAKATVSDQKKVKAFADEQWGETTRVKEIKDDARAVLQSLDSQLEAHAARHPPFAQSLELYRTAVKTFEEQIAEVASPDAASAAFAGLIQQVTGLADQDEPIQNDIASARANLERLQQELAAAGNGAGQTERRLLETLPRFVYFDDVDLLEDEVNIDQFLADPSKSKTLANLVALAGLDVERLHQQDVFERQAATEVASTEITGLVNKSWTQEGISLTLNADGTALFVIVKDETGGYDPPSKRSKGFQWYLGFYINFNAGSQRELTNTVLLLDDPGVYLHPSGQRDLLKTTAQLAKNNQFVIATHSPFMIDREHLGRIRIVQRSGERQGTKLREKWHESEQDAFEPIRASLGLTIGDSLFTTLSNVVVEGMADCHILSGMSRVCERLGKPYIDLNDVALLGVGGASKVPYWALLIFKQKLKVAALLDDDQQGRKAHKVLVEELGMDEGRATTLKEFAQPGCGDVELEDLIEPEFYYKAFDQAYKPILEKKAKVDKGTLVASQCSRTKPYEDFFKREGIGKFDKVIVAKALADICSSATTDASLVGTATLDRFATLFDKLGEMLKADL